MSTPPTIDLTPAVLNVRLYRGDDSTIKVTLADAAGAPVALPTTGWSAQLRVSRDVNSVAATATINATEAAAGVLYVTFPDTTGLPSSLYYDVQCTTGGLRTWLQGRLTISQDVTRA